MLINRLHMFDIIQITDINLLILRHKYSTNNTTCLDFWNVYNQQVATTKSSKTWATHDEDAILILENCTQNRDTLGKDNSSAKLLKMNRFSSCSTTECTPNQDEVIIPACSKNTVIQFITINILR